MLDEVRLGHDASLWIRREQTALSPETAKGGTVIKNIRFLLCQEIYKEQFTVKETNKFTPLHSSPRRQNATV